MSNVRSLGKYQLIAELGHGGMAEVFLAMVAGPLGSGFTKLAVVKKLRPHLTEDLEFVAMLVDEARISARLNHPNVVQTLEVGVENGEYFLAMEFLDGQPLHRIQRRAQRAGTPLPAYLEYVIVADTLAGLQHAHELADYDGTPLGIVHRDVTPQNIFVTYAGQVKVVDFGIAKAAGRASETRQGIVKGKVRYMSPEQAMGQPVDCRADVFSAGVLLWEAATKQHFWRDLDELAIVQALIAGEYDASPRSVAPDVPAEIDEICRRAMARDADDRYATAADLRADLDKFIADDIVFARRRLGPLVSELFTKERRKLREVIEQMSRTHAEPMSLATLAASHSMQLALMDSLSASAAISGVSVITTSEPSAVPSLAPVVMTGSIPPPSTTSVTKAGGPSRGFQNAALFATAAVAAAMVIAFGVLQLGGTTQLSFANATSSTSSTSSAGHPVHATAGQPSSRTPAELVLSRRPITVRSAPSRKSTGGVRAEGGPVAPAPAPAAAPVPAARTHAHPTRVDAAPASPAASASASAMASASDEGTAAPSTSASTSPTTREPGGPSGREGSKRKPAIDMADPWNTGRP